jgi:outer membrane biosynthesis protein TonB
MASESLTPPPSGGGFAKYLVVLLLLVGGGLGVYFASRKAPEPPKTIPPVENAERSTALTPDTVEIPPDEPEAVEDAAVAAPEPVKKPRGPAIDPWACEGDIPAADLRKALAEGSSAIRSCYERQLRNNNQLQGEVRLQVRVGNDGKVTGTRVTGTLHDPEVKSCMQNVAKGWSFPAPAGGACAVFDAPFKLTPKQ